jgi:histidinol-phosphate aminotransferase
MTQKTQNMFTDLAAPGVRSLRPYQPGKPEEELQREYGVEKIIKLASNENPLGPSPKVLQACQSSLIHIARYPDDNGFRLKSLLAHKHGVGMHQITLGSGSCNVLELIMRAFVTAGQEVVFSEYAFAMYPILTQAVGAKAVAAPARNWGHDLNAMHAAVNENTRLVFVANPNNPTGTWLGGSELKDFIRELPKHVLVVVDEAYFEYASFPALQAEDYPNAMDWLEEFPNLIVTRTFSKAYGLAGLRVGYGVSHPNVADLINRIRQPFNVNNIALAAAETALEDSEHLQRSLQLNAEQLQHLTQRLTDMGLEVIPSVANFICVKVKQSATQLYDDLLHSGVIVRPIGVYNMPEHLRVTVGLADENEFFLCALAKAISS